MPKAFLTIKGVTVGATRPEYEYEIPFDEGKAMLDALAEKPVIEEEALQDSRRRRHVGGRRVLGDNAGLIVAEVELTSEGQAFDMPAWIGEEVTGDPRYYNAKSYQESVHTVVIIHHAAVRDCNERRPRHREDLL